MSIEIIQILMERDDLTQEQAEHFFAGAKEMVAEGMDPMEVLTDHLELDIDYLFHLI